jgi:anti-sigma regulatory factor (Ser/Thr protein kinase)
MGQGDILERCPVFLPPADRAEKLLAGVAFAWQECDVIVMSQTSHMTMTVGLSTRISTHVDNRLVLCLQYRCRRLTIGAIMAPKPQTAEIRKFIIDRVEKHPRDIARLVTEAFGITRQAAGRHLASITRGGLLEASGNTRNRAYSLAARRVGHSLPLSEHRDEDKVWRAYVAPELEDLAENVLGICHYGFTEMFNNVIDHSAGSMAYVEVEANPRQVALSVADDGVGAFENIRSRLGLEDHREAIFALSKGKVTTDPTRHTGQGIFFTSRIFDEFSLASNGLTLMHFGNGPDWLVEREERGEGTIVTMTIARDSAKTLKEHFDRYSDVDSEDYGFTKSHVPLVLAKYGMDDLVSRSQAKRVLSGVQDFKEVFLDFRGIDFIGQAFADEIFRVFPSQHPGITVTPIGMSDDVARMVARAKKSQIDGEQAGGPG